MGEIMDEHYDNAWRAQIVKADIKREFAAPLQSIEERLVAMERWEKLFIERLNLLTEMVERIEKRMEQQWTTENL